MTDAEPPPAGPSGPGVRLLQRIVEVRAEEVPALCWAGAYFFALLSAYFIIRPLREEMGVRGGVANLPWLFTGTLIAMLVAHPPFGALVAKLPRRRFVPLTYRFFAVNLLTFFALLHLLPAAQHIWLGRVFFVWTSVFNLFVISVFWGFMADVFTPSQGRRLFGFIGVGGTVGGLAGSTLTAEFATVIGPTNLLLVSAVLLELSTRAAGRLSAAVPSSPANVGATGRHPGDPEAVIGGGVLAGVTHVARSPYLLGICGYMLLFSIGSTVLYFEQAGFASTIADPAERTVFFARIEQIVQVITIFTQAFLTGRIIQYLGVAATLVLLPALSVAGFLTLGLAHTVGVFVVFQVFRRAGEFAVAKPTREVLYTVVSREDKYKAKNFIDTFVYRAGDQVGAWSYTLIGTAGVAAATIALIAAPLSAVWLGIAVWLGRRHEAMAPDARGRLGAPATAR